MRFENKVAIGRVLRATVAAQIVFARGQKGGRSLVFFAFESFGAGPELLSA